MWKHKHKISRAGKNTLYNANKRLNKAKRLWKSENYLKDLQTHLSKLH